MIGSTKLKTKREKQWAISFCLTNQKTNTFVKLCTNIHTALVFTRGFANCKPFCQNVCRCAWRLFQNINNFNHLSDAPRPGIQCNYTFNSIQMWEFDCRRLDGILLGERLWNLYAYINLFTIRHLTSLAKLSIVNTILNWKSVQIIRGWYVAKSQKSCFP